MCAVVISLGVLVGASGQEDERDTVGLALDGGGALGFAHVGVLLELEDRGIPVDYVAGTSMGSVVGALYAAGHSAEEIAQLTEETNWNELFSDQPARRRLPYDQRRQDAMYSVTLGFRDAEPLLGSGVTTGQNIVELLDRLLSSYAVSGSFNRFPRPLRVVATNLVTGEERVFHEGDVKTAVRASLAVPGAFTPVYYQREIYVDGGLVNSVPVDRLLEFEPDYIIAVRLGTLAQETELDSAPAVIQQSSVILRHDRVMQNLEHADIVIAPDVGEFSAASFGAAMELLDAGREAVDAVSDEIDELAEKIDRKVESPKRRPDEDSTISVERITYSQDSPPADVRERLEQRLVGTTTTSEIRSEVYRTYETGGYRFVTYVLSGSVPEVPDEPPGDRESGYILDVHLGLRVKRTTEVQAGFSFRSDFWSPTAPGFMTHWNLLVRDAPIVGLRSSSSIWLGETINAASQLRYRIAPSTAVTLGAYNINPIVRFYDERMASSVYTVPSIGIHAGAVTVLRESVELWVDGLAEWVNPSLQTGSSRTMDGDGLRIGIDVAGRADTLDRYPFPRRGTQTEAAYHFRFVPGDRHLYHTATAHQRWFVPLFRRSALALEARLATDFDSGLPEFEQFAIGGIRSFRGLYTNEIRGNHRATVAIGARIRVLDLPFVAGKTLYVTMRSDFGRAWDGTYASIAAEPALLGAFSVGLAAGTVVGRASAAVGMTTDGRISAGIEFGNDMNLP